jgi:AmmeMemoRadiSam system protein A
MSSTERSGALNFTERRKLVDIARKAIHAGVNGRRPSVRFEELSAPLCAMRATFVTLHVEGDLRGCIGTLEPFRPLAVDVAENAYASAFSDPRFPPVSVSEVERLLINISILGAPEPLYFESETDLLRQLRPGVDGLVLNDHGRRATLLPSVWEQVPDRRDFLAQLKLKAGLPADYWSKSIEVYRYITTSVP